MSLNPAYPDGSAGKDVTTDNTTEGHYAVKLSNEFSDGNLTQDLDGKIRASEQIIAEKGVDSTPATYVSGDGMDISSSGPSQINRSRVTGVRYQIPYQEIDKSGSGVVFSVDVGAEIHEERQVVYDTQLVSPSAYSIDVTENEIINAFYVKTDGDVSNYRFRITAQPSGNTVASYPDKFRYARGEGVSLVGAGIHKLDMYYIDGSAPTRFIVGQNIDFEEKWESAGGYLLGNSVNEPWYEIDIQHFELKDVVDINTVLNTETSTALMQFVIDEDNLISNSNTKVPTQSSVKSYIDAKVTSGMIYKGEYDASTNLPNLTVAPTGVLLGYFYTVTVGGTFFSKGVDIGDVLISEVDDPSTEADWTILNKHLDAESIKALYESNPNTNAFTDYYKSKLDGVEPLAEVNNISDTDVIDLTNGGESTLHYHSSDRDRVNHTGTQTASTISDFDDEVSNNLSVVANTSKVSADGSVISHLDVTDSGSGAIITDIERTSLGNQSGINTGDQDLSSLALKNNVLELNNTDEFTPDSDYEPSTKKYVDDNNAGGDMLSSNNLSDVVDKSVARTNLEVDIYGTDNSTNVTLSSDDPTQEGLDLAGQILTANQATQTTDGLMSSGDKLEHDHLVANSAGDSWVSGGLVTENAPKDQKVSYGAVSYQINGIDNVVTPAGIYDLENGYLSVNHYSGMIDDQHAFVNIFVDADQVIKSERGSVVVKGEIAHAPLLPSDSVCIAIVEIKVNKYDIPKDIRNKDIEDCRHSGVVNTDRTVSISVDDETEGYLIDKLSNDGNVTFSIVNAGGIESIKAEVSTSGGTASRLHAIRSLQLDVTGTSDTICAFDPTQTVIAEGLSVNVEGNILASDSGFYTGNIKIYSFDTGDPEVNLWIEHKPYSAGVWALYGTMLRFKIKDASGFTFPINGGIDLLENDELRIKFGTVDPADRAKLTTITQSVDLGTMTQYAASLFMHKVGDVTP